MQCVFLEGITGLRLCNCWDGKYANNFRAAFIPLKHGKRSVLSVDVERWAQPSPLRCLFFVSFHVALLSVWNARHTSRLWPDFYRLQFLWEQSDLNPQMNSKAQFTKKKTHKHMLKYKFIKRREYFWCEKTNKKYSRRLINLYLSHCSHMEHLNIFFIDFLGHQVSIP